MPGVATSLHVSPDNQFILATGTYKPRVKCYEFNNLSVKFERCFDSEIEKFVILSDDYSKMAFLSCDRHIEFHTAAGGLYKLRIPRFGRDIAYHQPSCDILVAAASTDLYRLNLERGQFMQPFPTDFPNNCLAINPEHYLICTGNEKGHVESFDHRMKRRCGILNVHEGLPDVQDFQITSLGFKNGLIMAAGTSTGQVLLYDIRSKRPLVVKDHMNDVAIKKVLFNAEENAVYSMDSGVLKIWDENSGKQIAYIESQSEFNDMATIPNTGLLFFAQEDTKMLSYYIPAMGPAPRWCSFLDSFIEDIESQAQQNIYDDYKFVTNDELVDLGLYYLKGTNLLRSYMHGHFMDVRLFNKVKNANGAVSLDKYKAEKVAKVMAESAPNRVVAAQVAAEQLPKYNKKVAAHYLDPEVKSKKNQPNLMDDSRFKMMFEDADFIVDEQADEYKLVRPVLSRLSNQAKKLAKGREAAAMVPRYGEVGEIGERDEVDSDKELIFSADDAEDSSSDDERMTKALKRQHKIMKKERKREGRQEDEEKEKEKTETGEQLGGSLRRIDLDDRLNVNRDSELNRKLMRWGWIWFIWIFLSLINFVFF